MQMQKSKRRLLGIILAVLMSFFAIQQGGSVQDLLLSVREAAADQLAVHTWEHQQGSFLDILAQSELMPLAQARISRVVRGIRPTAQQRGVSLVCLLAAELLLSVLGSGRRFRWIEPAIVRSHAWIMAYIHWQDGEKAAVSLK